MSWQSSSFGNHRCVTPVYHIPMWNFNCVLDQQFIPNANIFHIFSEIFSFLFFNSYYPQKFERYQTVYGTGLQKIFAGNETKKRYLFFIKNLLINARQLSLLPAKKKGAWFFKFLALKYLKFH